MRGLKNFAYGLCAWPMAIGYLLFLFVGGFAVLGCRAIAGRRAGRRRRRFSGAGDPRVVPFPHDRVRRLYPVPPDVTTAKVIPYRKARPSKTR